MFGWVRLYLVGLGYVMFGLVRLDLGGLGLPRYIWLGDEAWIPSAADNAIF